MRDSDFDSKKFIDELLKTTGHSATQAVANRADQLAGATVNAAEGSKDSVPDGLPSMAINTTLSIFNRAEAKKQLAEQIKKTTGQVDETVDSSVEQAMEVISTTL